MNNLDAMEPEELRKFATQMTRLTRYATKKARAMELRVEGNIQAALGHEKDLERIYSTIAPEYKW